MPTAGEAPGDVVAVAAPEALNKGAEEHAALAWGDDLPLGNSASAQFCAAALEVMPELTAGRYSPFSPRKRT